MSSQDELSGGKSSFQSQFAEGDIMAKQGEYKKAIESYTKALEFRSNEKNVLFARSRMYLAMGDALSALKDAETALAEDPEFFKAKYQKAEALYAMGDFETSLVFYHRGHQARPEMDEFRLGIQKAREAIDNSIGNKINPEDYRHQVEKMERVTSSHGVTQHRRQSSKRTGGKLERIGPKVSPANAKLLLGDMYPDMEYLENLLEDKDFKINANEAVRQLAVEGLNYLDSRIEFWRQQKPIYTSKRSNSGPTPKQSPPAQRAH